MGNPYIHRIAVLRSIMGRRDLSDSLKRKVAAQHPQYAHLVGMPQPHKLSAAAVEQSVAETKPKKLRRVKPKRGNIIFDSENEAKIYDRLLRKFKLVVAHGCLMLSQERHINPDYIIIHKVITKGRYRGMAIMELADAKAVWKEKNCAHVERDWAVKKDWLFSLTGLRIRIITQKTLEGDL